MTHPACTEELVNRYMCVWRSLRCNGCRRRKWIRWHEFKSWTRLIAFPIALILLEKVSIKLFSLQPWINTRVNWVLLFCLGNQSRRRKTLNSKLLKIDLVSHPACMEGLVNTYIRVCVIYIYQYVCMYACQNQYFRWSLTGLNWKFSFSEIVCYSKVEESVDSIIYP